MRKAKQAELIVLLLRDFARRTAKDHHANLQAAHVKLRTINTLALDILAASRRRQRRKAAL
jgi:hypothetical protein